MEIPARGNGDAAAEGPRRLYVFNGGFVTSARLRRILGLAGWKPVLGLPGPGDTVGVWGHSPTAWRGERMAQRRGAGLLRVEDAFLRSVKPGRQGTPPLGLLLDRTGVHFDASAPSDLEHLLARHPLDDHHLLARARDGIERLRRADLSKYNIHDRDCPLPAAPYVLVMDQTRGDASIRHSGASEASFAEMLERARDENPGARIVIKAHPETRAGLRPGHFGPGDLDRHTLLLTDPVSPWELLDGATAVYAVSSQLGFEAVLAGHRPRLMGRPFYAGWDLTDDHTGPIPRRGRRLTRVQLFAAAMLLAPTWYDPYQDRLCDFETAADTLEAQARAWREDRPGYEAWGMRAWKRAPLQRFLGRERPIRFMKPLAQVAEAAAQPQPQRAQPIPAAAPDRQASTAMPLAPANGALPAPSPYPPPKDGDALTKPAAQEGPRPRAMGQATNVVWLFTGSVQPPGEAPTSDLLSGSASRPSLPAPNTAAAIDSPPPKPGPRTPSTMAEAKPEVIPPRRLIVWANRQDIAPPGAIRVEDGFLRSKGLGADLVPPLSLVLDDLGIYYDPGRESRLERLIAASVGLTPAELARAARLRGAVLAAGISKYNLGGAVLPALPQGNRILVPGQVEDDASILTGAGPVRSNLALLQAARAANPEAVLIYKPHPDVEAGLRQGRIAPEAALELADLVLDRGDPITALDQVAEVWTMTSLLGFEALIRGKRVTCLGQPFYAGWGLTTDLGAAPDRRTARPTLDGLVHAVLIGYPRYLDPVTGLPAPPEVIVQRLADPNLRTGAGPGLRLLAKAQGWLAGYAHLWR